MMKTHYLAISFIFLCMFGYIQADPLVVITLMVKNEAEVIRPTLQPYIDAGLDCFVVYDTGSTDGTPEIAREFFKAHNCAQAYVIEEPFVDFATSRNRALERTYQQFPAATFVLMIDAEWYVHNVDELLHFCHEKLYDEEPIYLIRISNKNTAFYTSRLIRCSARPWFVGPVHEQLNLQASVRVPDAVYFEYSPSSQGSRRSRERWERDAQILLKEIAEHPHDVRTMFYLAQTMSALQRLHEAYNYYNLCASLNPQNKFQDELIYLAYYRCGSLAQQLAPTDAQFTWMRAMGHYIDAFSCRPHRAEPLVAIAQHYWDTREPSLCFLFARHAAELPYPPDYFCVEQDAYNFTRYNLLGASAGCIGQFELGKWAVHKALECYPDAPHLLHNLAEFERLERKFE
jgi:tetratricopeptide (TPR) repeat protein